MAAIENPEDGSVGADVEKSGLARCGRKWKTARPLQMAIPRS